MAAVREDTRSHDENGAAHAARQRALRTGEYFDPPEVFAEPSTWDPANVPEYLKAYAREASVSETPPF